jgi:hypothetical protein
VGLVEVRNTQPTDGSDLSRADDGSAGAVYDPKAAYGAAVDSAAIYGGVS